MMAQANCGHRVAGSNVHPIRPVPSVTPEPLARASFTACRAKTHELTHPLARASFLSTPPSCFHLASAHHRTLYLQQREEREGQGEVGKGRRDVVSTLSPACDSLSLAASRWAWPHNQFSDTPMHVRHAQCEPSSPSATCCNTPRKGRSSTMDTSRARTRARAHTQSHSRRPPTQ